MVFTLAKEIFVSFILVIRHIKGKINFKNSPMKLFISFLLVAILSGCTTNKNTIDKKSWKTVNLNAYSAGANEKSVIRSMLNSDTSQQTTVELDKVKYKLVQFNSITDTLKGKYDLQIEKKEKSQTIKIIRL